MTAAAFVLRDGAALLHRFAHLGMVGLLLVAAIDSSFVPLPLPGVTDILLVLFAAAKVHPLLLLAISTAGSALGGFLSHSAGQKGGQQFLEKHVPPRILERVNSWMEHHAILSVALPAILPPPVPLSPFVLAAGAAHMSRRKFMTAFTLSRALRHAVAIGLGVHYGPEGIHLWNSFSHRWGTTILIAFWSVTLLCTGLGIWRLIRNARELEKSRPKTAT